MSIRPLLIYNFGFAAIFLLIGSLSVYAFDMVQPSALAVPQPLDTGARQMLGDEQDLERRRTHALFYFALAQDLRLARLSDTHRFFYDVRFLSYVVAGMFAVGGLLVLGVLRRLAKQTLPVR